MKYYDDSWMMKWNHLVLTVRRMQRRISLKSAIAAGVLLACIPILVFFFQCRSQSCSLFRDVTERQQKPEPEAAEENDPFTPRVITHAYDISVRKPTSMLWPNGCPGEKARQPLLKCEKPRNKIMFVKTHKCASSTISAAILRYALNKNLQVALPKYDLGHIGWPSPYRPFHVWGFSIAGFHDVLAHHSVYDRCYIRHDFPKPQTIYTTIIRHPFDQFKSSVNFFKEERKILPKKEEAVVKFLLNPEKYEKNSRLLYGRLYFGEKSFTKNLMSTDLGFPPSQFENETSIDLFIKRIDKDFELVMIKEYFDESLVLLKRLMCWELKDLIYIKLNINRSKKYTNSEQDVTEEMLKTHRRWSRVDYDLYNFFNETFWQKIEAEGNSFTREVDLFKHMVQEFTDFCHSTWMNGWVYPPSEFNKQFTMTKEDCRKLRMMPEHLTPTLWMMSNARLTWNRDNPFNTRALWTNMDAFEKWY